jgi:hypothetical protein
MSGNNIARKIGISDGTMGVSMAMGRPKAALVLSTEQGAQLESIADHVRFRPDW